MKKNLIGLLVLGFFLAPLCVQAQGVSPWFRGGKEAWKVLSGKSFHPSAVSSVVKLPRIAVPDKLPDEILTIKPATYMFGRTHYTNVFSRVEKEAFQFHPENLVADLGKIAYFYDRDKMLLTTQQELYPDMPYAEEAYQKHQHILAQMYTKMYKFITHQSELSTYLENGLLKERYPDLTRLHPYWTDILHSQDLLQEGVQPFSQVLTMKEIDYFSTLGFTNQFRYANEQAQAALTQMSQLLQHDPATLKNEDFRNYQRAKWRWDYFQTVQNHLLADSEALSSLVVREPVALPFDFLPEPDELLTDAQRLGKLAFYSHDEKLSTDQKERLQKELKRQTKLCAKYAEAEAFNVPVHRLLRNYHSKQLTDSEVFGVVGGETLNRLDENQIFQKTPAVLQRIKETEESLHSIIFAPTKETYAEYFRLEYKRHFYQYKQTLYKLKHFRN